MASVAARCMRTAAARTSSSFAPVSVAAAAPRQGCLRIAAPAQRLFSTTRMLEERKYTREHEWIDLSADRKTGVIGISEYAAEALGDVVYVELPQLPSGGAGNWVGQGDAVGAVESVKSAADINAPLRLRVTQINGLLEDKPSTINQVPEDDSHGGGWLAKVEVDEESLKGWDGLMTPEEYKSFTSGH